MANPAAHPAAARHYLRGVEVRLVLPEHFARVDTDREHIVIAGDHIEGSLVFERLRLP